MAILKAGGSAIDAIELAVKCLEDREITNSGYGSNLAVDGIVECDAVVVDHNGRSGGAGAVSRTLFSDSPSTLKLTLGRNQEPNLASTYAARSLFHGAFATPGTT